jgi:hypothetical protein
MSMRAATRLPVLVALAIAAASATAVPGSALAQRGAQRATPPASTPASTRGIVQLPRARPARDRPPSLRPTTGRQFFAQGAARARLLGTRAATLPAYIWPVSRVAAALAHGEPFTGLTPKSAVNVAVKNARERRMATTIGRLAPSLNDSWSVKGAERSYVNLIRQIAQASRATPGLDASIAIDPHSFGYDLAAVPRRQRESIALEGMMRVARAAHRHGVGVEMDVTSAEALPFIFRSAKKMVTDHQIPVRLAIAARYRQSNRILREWAELADQTGIRLGVRLVKGSFVEAEARDAINERRPLLDHYKRIVSTALTYSDRIDVAVATQNEEIYEHAQAEAARLGADFSVHVIRGVNAPLQQRMRAAGRISREYVSYGADAPGFGLTELLTNRRERSTIMRNTGVPRTELD